MNILISIFSNKSGKTKKLICKVGKKNNEIHNIVFLTYLTGGEKKLYPD